MCKSALISVWMHHTMHWTGLSFSRLNLLILYHQKPVTWCETTISLLSLVRAHLQVDDIIRFCTFCYPVIFHISLTSVLFQKQANITTHSYILGIFSHIFVVCNLVVPMFLCMQHCETKLYSVHYFTDHHHIVHLTPELVEYLTYFVNHSHSFVLAH